MTFVVVAEVALGRIPRVVTDSGPSKNGRCELPLDFRVGEPTPY